MGQTLSVNIEPETFIRRWREGSGGAERANYQMFLMELCDLIGVDHPDQASANTDRNDYVFERAVRFQSDDGSTSLGRIDLYKRGCFVLEAKQSRIKGAKKEVRDGPTYSSLSRPKNCLADAALTAHGTY